jgi:phage nucleotide-binding protein
LLGTGHNVFNVVKAMDNQPNLEKIISDLYETLCTQDHPWKNVVIDNLSELEQQLIIYLTSSHKKEVPELREYGDASFKMKEWVRNFRDLIYKDINVVFNAWEIPIEVKNSNGEILSRTFPLIGKKIAPQICGLVDVVGHMEIYPKNGNRWVRFGPHEQYITKSQFAGLVEPGNQTGGWPADFPTIIKKLRDHQYGKSQA